MRAPTFVLALGCLASVAAPTGAQQLPNLAPYLMVDGAAEVALARTAAPGAISDSAAVLVLTRTGYVEAAKGSNGFTCVVFRSFAGDANDAAFMKDPGFWNPRVRAPHCFNPAASRTVLRAMLAGQEWVLRGTSPADAAKRVRRAYETREFSTAPGAMAYMLSPQQWLAEADPHWRPHLMFYFDRSASAPAWGAGGMTAPVINASAGDPTFPVITLLVPVPQWSDGTSAPTAGSH